MYRIRSRTDSSDYRAWLRRKTNVADYRRAPKQPVIMQFATTERVKSILSTAVPQHDVEDAIQSSKYMLDWDDNWDGDSSSKYEELTWSRATTFVRNAMKEFRAAYGAASLNAPKIVTGADGTIDVRWQADNRQLVVNISANDQEALAFYGKDLTDRALYITGTLRFGDAMNPVFEWLIER
jgi:hypothetical protein